MKRPATTSPKLYVCTLCDGLDAPMYKREAALLQHRREWHAITAKPGDYKLRAGFDAILLWPVG